VSLPIPLPVADLERRVWRRPGPVPVWQGEPGEGALFDPLSGETHFLGELPALIVSVLDDHWASRGTLVERIAGPVALEQQAEAQILAALVSLEAAELVESQSPETE
jgi:PqqD family protein of HPr-rel-A system